MPSLITITANKNNHLNNLLEAISLQTILPREVIVVDLTGDVKIEKEYNFFIKVQALHFTGDSLSIAAAKNLGARNAWEEDLIFLNVDCIPNPSFIEKMEEHLLCASGLIAGEPRQLKAPIEELNNEKSLFENSFYHDNRPELTKELTSCSDPGMFWSPGFGIKKKLFFDLGGFDENYLGVGPEDTDFAFSVREKKIDFYLAKNVVYHHPPEKANISRNDFDSIIRNSNYFYKKWGEWPMKTELKIFAEKDLIEWSESRTEAIRILERPVTEMPEYANEETQLLEKK